MKKLLLILGGLIAVAVIGYYVLQNTYNKPHVDYENTQALYEVTAEEFLTEFQEMMDAANEKYADKVIALRGDITDIQEGYLMLNNQIMCTLSSDPSWPIEDFVVGSAIVVKGRVIGFDDLLGEIKLDNCTVTP